MKAGRFASGPLKFPLIHKLVYVPCIFFKFNPGSISFLQTDPTKALFQI
jgi:hypothetical protein